MGADRGILISDRAFAGADVLATSYTLAQGIQWSGEYDLILCGKQTTDGDTAQVGPETAEFLGMEHVSNVLKVLKAEEGSLEVLENQENEVRRLQLPLPCLLTMEKDANTPRLPSYKRKLEMGDQGVEVISLKDFKDKDTSHYGANGSPTRVERIFPPEKNTARQMYEGEPKDLAASLGRLLKERKFI